jgi:hypothetical protein
MKFPRHGLGCGALAVFLAGATSASAQEQKISCDEVPGPVRTAFERAYPGAAVKGCAEEVEAGKTVYEIQSVEGGTGRDALFHADGAVIVVEETVAVGNVPEPVQQAVHKRYPNGVITLAEKVTRDAAVLYEFRVKDGDSFEEIVFDGSGKEVEHSSGQEAEQ